MLGTWPLTSVEEREAISFLILHLPTDGRLEVVIRETQSPFDRLLEEHGKKDILHREKAQ